MLLHSALKFKWDKQQLPHHAVQFVSIRTSTSSRACVCPSGVRHGTKLARYGQVAIHLQAEIDFLVEHLAPRSRFLSQLPMVHKHTKTEMAVATLLGLANCVISESHARQNGLQVTSMQSNRSLEASRHVTHIFTNVITPRAMYMHTSLHRYLRTAGQQSGIGCLAYPCVDLP